MAETGAQEIKDWIEHPVTILFMQYVENTKDTCDEETHCCLITPSRLQEAMIENAGVIQLQKVLGIPAQMVEDAVDKAKEGE